MKRTKVSSPNFVSIGYDEENEILEIELLNGGIYQYYAVPLSVYKGLMNILSRGTFFDMFLKKARYKYKKIKWE